MIKAGQVYKNNRSNKEYYRVVSVKENVVNASMYDFSVPKYETDNHMREKRVDIFLPHFEDTFSPRSEEELAMKLLKEI